MGNNADSRERSASRASSSIITDRCGVHPRLIALRRHHDERGRLDVAEITEGLPFAPRRCFIVSDVPSGTVRGGHALRCSEELLVCVSGSCAVTADSGVRHRRFILGDSNVALYIPPMVWVSYEHASSATVLVVLASTEFARADHIDDWPTFRSMVMGEH